MLKGCAVVAGVALLGVFGVMFGQIITGTVPEHPSMLDAYTIRVYDQQGEVVKEWKGCTRVTTYGTTIKFKNGVAWHHVSGTVVAEQEVK
jgi:hypothetical protein